MEERLVNISIIGTGYVGLVTAACFAEFGNHVVCVDKDVDRIEELESGKVPFFEPGLDELVERVESRAIEVLDRPIEGHPRIVGGLHRGGHSTIE